MEVKSIPFQIQHFRIAHTPVLAAVFRWFTFGQFEVGIQSAKLFMAQENENTSVCWKHSFGNIVALFDPFLR